jgi:hypothetical protein
MTIAPGSGSQCTALRDDSFGVLRGDVPRGTLRHQIFVIGRDNQ